MSQIETGKRLGMQAVALAKIAQVLHVSVDQLLGLKVRENGGEEREGGDYERHRSIHRRAVERVCL
jgi:hypothetical protein